MEKLDAEYTLVSLMRNKRPGALSLTSDEISVVAHALRDAYEKTKGMPGSTNYGPITLERLKGLVQDFEALQSPAKKIQGISV